jgi:hypothetical protein
MKLSWLLVAGLVWAGVFAAGLPAGENADAGGPGLSAQEFQKLHEALRPPQEAWEALPWRLAVVEACAAAAEQKKPVYMLVRSGHPLGCV